MPSPDQPRTVLVVDDNRELRALLVEFLAEEGFEPLQAEDGLDALRILRERRPDAVLLDLMMPRLGGVQTLEKIRAFDPDIQVVVITATIDPALLRPVVFSSATAVLTKPLQFDDVAAALRWRAEPARSPATAPPLSVPRRILVVDDDPAVRATIEEVLAGAGHDVCGVADGVAALRIIVAQPPDLVLLDVRMPGLDGLDVLASIRAVAPTLKVIMISGATGQRVANEAFAHGVSDYIGKPIDPAYLELSVETALAEGEVLMQATAGGRRPSPAPRRGRP